jgi:Tfp pilus assembly protein PilF
MDDDGLGRTRLLFYQKRYALAEQEARAYLARWGKDPGGLVLLSLSLMFQSKFDEAKHAVEEAVALDPECANSYACYSVLFAHQDRFAEAEAKIREAIRLEPENPDHFARLGAFLLSQETWREALNMSLEGLALNPEHADSLKVRAAALSRLEQKGNAHAAIDEALARDPNDDTTHSIKGMALLEEMRPGKAIEHFREALRINPFSNVARWGLIDAKNALNPIYRVTFFYYAFLDRASDVLRWSVLAGGYLGGIALVALTYYKPSLFVWLLPAYIAYAISAFLALYGAPCFNLIRSFNRQDRFLMLPKHLAAARWFGACFVTFCGAIAGYLFTQRWLLLYLAIFSLGMALPLVKMHYCSLDWATKCFRRFAIALAMCGILAMAFASVHNPTGLVFAVIFSIGALATPIVSHFLTRAKD